MKNGFTNFLAVKYKRALFVLPLCLLFSIFGPGNQAIAAESSGPFVILIGPPASGKTSNGNYISEKYGIPSIDALKVLQDEMATAAQTKTPTGKPGSRRSNAWSERNKSIRKAMKKLENGELVQDDVINSSVLMRLSQEDCKDGFVLDGYPGTVQQAIYLDGLLAAHGLDSLQVIYLDVSDEFALEKMTKRDRSYDTGGFAEKRLELFRANIEAVLSYYEGDSLHMIDATKEKAEVRVQIDDILGQ